MTLVDLVMNDTIKREIQTTIHKIKNLSQNQTELDQAWSDIKALFMDQLDSLPNLPASTFKKQNNKFCRSHPFWNDNLASA